jgi:hypothetical protein
MRCEQYILSNIGFTPVNSKSKNVTDKRGERQSVSVFVLYVTCFN